MWLIKVTVSEIICSQLRMELLGEEEEADPEGVCSNWEENCSSLCEISLEIREMVPWRGT